MSWLGDIARTVADNGLICSTPAGWRDQPFHRPAALLLKGWNADRAAAIKEA
ncbi:MAG: hypothetical protein ACLSHC_05250 [Bilophila wadsworthia]